MEKIDRRFDPIPHHYGNSRETTAQCIDLAVGAVVPGQAADVSGVGVSVSRPDSCALACSAHCSAPHSRLARAGLSMSGDGDWVLLCPAAVTL